MPFPMTHLSIAYNILRNTPQIKDSCDFLLGAIAPDSFHFSENYESGMKKASHLIVGDEKLGEVTNNEEWLENVLAFLQENMYMEKVDFIYGYCCHIIADIQNNIKIWTPFRLASLYTSEKGDDNDHHKEAYAVDNALYLLHQERETIMQILKNAVGYDIENIVVGKEIEKMKSHIFNGQFDCMKSTDLSSNKYVTLSIMQEFISTESEYIKEILFFK